MSARFSKRVPNKPGTYYWRGPGHDEQLRHVVASEGRLKIVGSVVTGGTVNVVFRELEEVGGKWGPRIMDADEAATMKREHARFRIYLRAITGVIRWFLKGLDAEMLKPSSVTRGRVIAALCNRLNRSENEARHFGLGESLHSKGEQ